MAKPAAALPERNIGAPRARKTIDPASSSQLSAVEFHCEVATKNRQRQV